MPLNRYFKGSGAKVMRDMKSRYGARGEEVFYRTANARGVAPRATTRRSGRR